MKGKTNPTLFSLEEHPLANSLCRELNLIKGQYTKRLFPDGESYLKIDSTVTDTPCILLADLSRPNAKYLPLIFLLDTLRELGAKSIGLVTPYLPYMRQDRRFVEGEAVTSRLFARTLSQHIDWLVTVDPHLHRYYSLNEIYNVPTQVVQRAPALADWLQQKHDVLLVGPDTESEQWVSEISRYSGHPYVIGEKHRYGDFEVEVTLPDIALHKHRTAVIIDDVISSGETILKCVEALQKQDIKDIQCAAIHGLFADDSDIRLLQSGLQKLFTSNTLPHTSNVFDVTLLLIEPILSSLQIQELNK